MHYRLLFAAFIFIAITNASCTSASKLSSDKLEQEQKIRHFVESKKFVFDATNMNPMRMNILNILPNGNQLQNLTSGYNLSIINDSLSVYLPYVGRAYSAPNPSSTNNGIKVNTKDFTYSFRQNRKGVYIVRINLNKDKSVAFFILNIGTAGYATLQVQNINRDAISFYGNINPIKGDIE